MAAEMETRLRDSVGGPPNREGGGRSLLEHIGALAARYYSSLSFASNTKSGCVMLFLRDVLDMFQVVEEEEKFSVHVYRERQDVSLRVLTEPFCLLCHSQSVQPACLTSMQHANLQFGDLQFVIFRMGVDR